MNVRIQSGDNTGSLGSPIKGAVNQRKMAPTQLKAIKGGQTATGACCAPKNTVTEGAKS